MSKKSILFLLLLLLKNVHTLSSEEENLAIEIQNGELIQYYQNRNHFKFKYEGEIGAKIIFEVNYRIDIYLTSPKGKREQVNYDFYYYNKHNYLAELTENGTYYIEVYCKGIRCKAGMRFRTCIFGGVIDTSGLSKKSYYCDFTLNSLNRYYGMNEYKVIGLNETKYVYFVSLPMNKYSYDYNNYYIYYPEKPDPPVDPNNPHRLIHYNNETIFEVYDIKYNESYKNLKIFKLEQNKEYIIKIHDLKYYYRNNLEELRFYYPKYFIFPITKDNFKVITGEEGFFSSSGPMLCSIQPNIDKPFTMLLGPTPKNNIFWVARTPEAIEPKLENIVTKMGELEFSESNELKIEKNDPYTTITFIVPRDYESGRKFYLVNDLIQGCNGSLIIPGNTSVLLICNGEKEFKYFNDITTFVSEKKICALYFLIKMKLLTI